jgi:hypothetical protein
LPALPFPGRIAGYDASRSCDRCHRCQPGGRAHADRSGCTAGGRALDEITLVAVSKTYPLADIAPRWLRASMTFGENRLEELWRKGSRRQREGLDASAGT